MLTKRIIPLFGYKRRKNRQKALILDLKLMQEILWNWQKYADEGADELVF